ncbi:MAG TPA: TraR/DksA family transcriptional regulator [Elusimicrobiota bacterium]|nr:TraR/DksA family transcriptional regulator [Elusimicrobiota bacterium]
MASKKSRTRKTKKSKSKKPVVLKINKQKGTQAYEKKLLQMRNDLLNVVRRKQEAEMPDMEVGDEADVATQTSERELLFELSDNERQMLDAIEAALRKIEQGKFGLCEFCSKKILKIRLKAMPHARYCIQCQSRAETPKG